MGWNHQLVKVRKDLDCCASIKWKGETKTWTGGDSTAPGPILRLGIWGIKQGEHVNLEGLDQRYSLRYVFFMFTLTLGNHPLSRAYVFRWIWNYHRANLLLLWMHLLFRWKFCMSNQSRVLASDRKKDKTCESETTLKKEHEIKHLVEFFSSENICFNYASMYNVYMIYIHIRI